MAGVGQPAPDGERELIAALAREHVARLAPQELPLFRATSEAYFKHPQDVANHRRASGDMLGFGGGAVVSFVTPVVLAVVAEVVSFLVAELRTQLKEESSSAIAALVKGLFRRLPQAHSGSDAPGDAPGDAPAAPPTLTAQQLERVRTRALDTAKRLGLADPQALTLADALTGSLAVGP